MHTEVGWRPSARLTVLAFVLLIKTSVLLREAQAVGMGMGKGPPHPEEPAG